MKNFIEDPRYEIDYVHRWCMVETENATFTKKGIGGKNLADAAAKMWLYLKKEKLI